MSVTAEQIEKFLSGSNPQEHIIKVEGSFTSDKVFVIYRGVDGKLKCEKDDFYPFIWATQAVSRCLFRGDRGLLQEKLSEYHIRCKGLKVSDDKGNTHYRMRDGYRVLFFAQYPMSPRKFQKFFEEAGVPIYEESKDGVRNIRRDFIWITPTEQYMVYTGKRYFKGYDDYDDLVRLQWDLETEGLDPTTCAISQIGIRTNKGYERIIPVEGEGNEKRKNEIEAIDLFFQTIRMLQPDVISGHNTENFDWAFIEKRLEMAGTKMRDFTKELFYGQGVYKSNTERVLKLGGEMEYFRPTILWGHNLTDSLHAVRRAQALDSDMKKADLKYVTKYSKINKKNRVYVPGQEINTTWLDTSPSYAFNDDNGNWFKITDKVLEKTYVNDDGIDCKRYEYLDDANLIDRTNNERFEIKTGRYIVERYLLDDLWETDKVELRYNLSNFLVTKLIPVAFEKVCTMGTAAIWKYIMLSFSYENDLAIPQFITRHTFTGGLSRLLSVGYVDNVVKLDYNSLYPSILLTYNITSPVDIEGAMLSLLAYVLTQREKYKDLKNQAGKRVGEIKEILKSGTETDSWKLEKLNEELKKCDESKSRNDKLQLPLKILANAFFGSYGSGEPFPWTDLECAEETTCVGRQMLRLMIGHFKGLGYNPIVGDSFTGDTPVFIKYKKSRDINIVPICSLFDNKRGERDALGREYDTSTGRNYWVYSRNGWQTPKYVYRHKTDKPIYRIWDRGVAIDVTEDHSLYTSERKTIKPSEITKDTELEYAKFGGLISNKYEADDNVLIDTANAFNRGELESIDVKIINANIKCKQFFCERIDKDKLNLESCNKTLLAQLLYINDCVRRCSL